MNEKNAMAWFLFLNPPPICQLFRTFRKMVTWHVTWPINTLFILWNVKNDGFFMCAKYWFRSIICAEVFIARKSFSASKPLDPGLNWTTWGRRSLTILKYLRTLVAIELARLQRRIRNSLTFLGDSRASKIAGFILFPRCLTLFLTGSNFNARLRVFLTLLSLKKTGEELPIV